MVAENTPALFRDLWLPLLEIGRSASGGYARHGWNAADHRCREWFTTRAAERSMTTETDAAGNLWAWASPPGPGAIVTGSHLDSVPDGGAYDGPLGVVSAFAALDLLHARGIRLARPLAVVAFSEEEGARFGVACLGSRVLAGVVENPDDLLDADGLRLADVAGALRPDPVALGRIAAYVELHIEQGRALADLGAPVALAERIWPHGRWRLNLRGAANHAGTTRLADRRDPMVAFAHTVLGARATADAFSALATIGRVQVVPNGTNAVPSAVTAWLDARAADDAQLEAVVEAITKLAQTAARNQGVELTVTTESMSTAVTFDRQLRDRLATVLGDVPVLGTGAGHDAGVLSAFVPTAMLFVRNPTGVSHAPDEYATDTDCAAGIEALAAVLGELAGE